MASYTPNLNLLKKSPVTDGNDTFNVDTMLNDNWDKIDDGISNVFQPGSFLWFAGTTPPDGFLVCDGSPVSRTTYSKLFSAIGTAFGTGDGSTTFNIPDLISRFIKGSQNVGAVSDGTYFRCNIVSSGYYVITNIGDPISTVSMKSATQSLGTFEGEGGNGYYVQPPNVSLLPCIKY